MDRTPTVSVIIPNYNHAPYLRERIDSVLNQTFQDFEIIMLDDHSADASPEVMAEYKDNPHISHIVINPENSGNTFLQWERGMQLARGEYIWIAESDDVAEPQFLATLIGELQKNPQATVAYSHSVMIDSDGQPMSMTWHRKGSSGKVNTFDGTYYVRKKQLVHNHIYNASMVVFRRSAIEKVPCDYQQYTYCGDWLFWTYIAMQGQVIEVCRPLNRYRQHSDKVSNMASHDGRNWSNMAGVLSTMASMLHLTPLQCRCLRGKCTKHFRKHERYVRSMLKGNRTASHSEAGGNDEDAVLQTLDAIRRQYSSLYGGTFFDMRLYEIGKLFGFLSKD